MQKFKIKEIARDVIQFEINALKNLKKNINKSFIEIIKTIVSCKNGNIIISGVGKRYLE